MYFTSKLIKFDIIPTHLRMFFYKKKTEITKNQLFEKNFKIQKMYHQTFDSFLV